MSSMSLMPPGAREWTVDDLDRMPDDGLQLVVEILSPSTRRKDVMLKRSKYQDCGLPHYWIVDPGGSGDREPSVEALALVDGSYRTAGTARGDQRLELAAPFPVTLVPADLAADPRTRCQSAKYEAGST
jgi:Uma2 family endonuclease